MHYTKADDTVVVACTVSEADVDHIIGSVENMNKKCTRAPFFNIIFFIEEKYFAPFRPNCYFTQGVSVIC